MMITEEVYFRYFRVYFEFHCPEELANLIEETILQAQWDSDETITEDEQVQLAVALIRHDWEMKHF